MKTWVAKHTGLPSFAVGPIPAGAGWRVTGSADGVEWLVAEGRSMGVLALSDPAAPFGVETTWTVTYGDEAVTGSVTRPDPEFPEDTWIADERGRHGFLTVWEGAEQTLSPRAQYAQPLSDSWPVQWRAAAPGGRQWTLEAHVEADRVPRARRVLDSGRLWVVHSHALCAPECTAPRAMLCGVDGDVQESGWPLGRAYKAKLRQMRPERTGVPVVTWGEARAAGIVWAPRTSFRSIRQQVAGEPA